MMRKIENKTTLMKYVELKKGGVPIEELLHSMYIEEKMSNFSMLVERDIEVLIKQKSYRV